MPSDRTPQTADAVAVENERLRAALVFYRDAWVEVGAYPADGGPDERFLMPTVELEQDQGVKAREALSNV
jgi:hypothetical protein